MWLPLLCYSLRMNYHSWRWHGGCDLHPPYRIGPREKYFHCEKCNLCLAKDLRGNHKVIFTVSLHSFPTFTTHSSKIFFFFISVCWKCFKAELSSVYGGKESRNTFNNSVASNDLFHVIPDIFFFFFDAYRTSTPPESELTFFHAAIFYTSMNHCSLNTVNSLLLLAWILSQFEFHSN